MFPVRCCIIVPMKVKIASPTAKSLVLLVVSTHFAALLPRGESSTMNAVMCIQAKGIEMLVPGMVTNRLVNGLTKNSASKPAFRITTGSHLRFIRNPTEIAATKSGRKSRPKKDTGLPNPIAPKFPSTTVKPPRYGPKMMPKIGARKSEKERYPPAPPMRMLKGMNRRTMYSAVKIVSRAICLVLWLLWAGLNMSITMEFFALLCNFLHRTAIKDFPQKRSIQNKP